MNIAVLLRAVPDPVEELELDGADLARDYLGYTLNEFDDHALEEGLLLKEETGGTLTVMALATADEIEQSLWTALAKGADRVIKLGDDLGVLSATAQAAAFAAALRDNPADLVLCGVQASDELEGQVAMLLAAALGLPHASVVVKTSSQDGGLAFTKEYWGGITADFTVSLPAVLGVQAARQPPRYVAVSKIRQAQQDGTIEELPAAAAEAASAVTVTDMRIPEAGAAEMIDGDGEEAAARIIDIIRQAGVA